MCYDVAMSNGDAATHALGEALGRVVKEAVAEAIKPLEDRMDSLEAEVREIHELVQIPETQERLALIQQGVKGD